MQEISVVKPESGIAAVQSDPLAQFLAGQLTDRTRRAYYVDLREFFATDDITAAAVRAVTFSDIIEYRNDLAAAGRKRATINRKLSSLKAFYKMMVAAGIVEKNPADSSIVRGYRIDETLAGKALPKNALQQIFDAVAEEEDDLTRSRDTAILYLLTYGGLRRSEVANVSWSDIRQEGVFHILHLPDTKSGVSQDIKLQAQVVHYVHEYRDELLRSGFPETPRAFISLSRNHSRGRPLTDQSINLIVRKYARRAGLSRNVTAHMFRHTCCTLSIEGGAKPQQVQAHLRHKDLKTTMRYYENRERLTDNASDYINIG